MFLLFLQFTFLIAQEILYKLLLFVNCVLVGSFEQFCRHKGPLLAMYLQDVRTLEAVNVGEKALFCVCPFPLLCS